jgi:hypothetical protein
VAVGSTRSRTIGVPASLRSVADRRAFLALIALAVAVPVIVGTASGALLIPHNDDFNYRRVALELYQSGRIELTGWTVMSLIGQIAAVMPLLYLSGGQPWAFTLLTAVAAVVGIAAGYDIARRLMPLRPTVLAVLTLVVFPGFVLNTTSFMTDIPALAAEFVCLDLGLAALARPVDDRMRWLIAAVAVGVFGFSIREFALAAIVAVVVAAWLADLRRPARYAVLGGVGLVSCAVIYVVTSRLPGQGTQAVGATDFSLDRIRLTLATLALVMLPVLAVATARWRHAIRRADLVVGLLIGLLLFKEEVVAVVTLHGVPRILIGNVLDPLGNLGGNVLTGDRPALFGDAVWDLLNVLALVGLVWGIGLIVAIVGAVVRGAWASARGGGSSGGRRGAVAAMATAADTPQVLLALFVLLYVAGILTVGVLTSIFDRYLWPLSLPLAVLLLGAPPGRRVRAGRVVRAASVASLGGLAVVSAMMLLNGDAYDAARWQMGGLAVLDGFAPQTVDAGVEWVGYHQDGLADVALRTSDPRKNWYAAEWRTFQLCAAVSSTLVNDPGWQLVTTDWEAWHLLLVAGPAEPMYLYRVTDADCPT